MTQSRFPVEGIRAKKRSAVRQIKGVGERRLHCSLIFLGLLVFFCFVVVVVVVKKALASKGCVAVWYFLDC